MKKLLLLFTVLSLITNSFAAFEIKPVNKKANEIFIPFGKDRKISLLELSNISIKDFEKITGKHLNFIDRMAFHSGQKKLQRSITTDGTINNKRILRFVNSEGDHSTGFHIGGFALGFLIGIIGVLIAYVAGGEEDVKRNRVKWAWIGFGLLTIIAIALALATSGL